MTDARERLFLGVDPGSKGALAVLDAWGCCVGTCRLEIPLPEVWAWLRGLTVLHADAYLTAVLERVSSMPGQGVASTFKFGASYGRCEALLVAAGIPFTEVAPGVWQRRMGVLSKKGESKSQHKRALREEAQRRWPAVRVTSHEADALLLAEYARQTP